MGILNNESFDRQTVIEGILELMSIHDVSTVKLANDLCLAKNIVSEWKKGRIKPSIEVIVALSRYFNVSTDYLLTGKETIVREVANEKRYKDMERYIQYHYVINGLNAYFEIMDKYYIEHEAEASNGLHVLVHDGKIGSEFLSNASKIPLERIACFRDIKSEYDYPVLSEFRKLLAVLPELEIIPSAIQTLENKLVEELNIWKAEKEESGVGIAKTTTSSKIDTDESEPFVIQM